MDKFINNTKKYFFLSQNDIFSSASIISGMIILSRLFGFIRYRTLTTFFTKEELDLFFYAFRLPDFVFEVIIVGALSSSFIPLFIKYKNNNELFYKKISSIINFILLSISILIIFLLLFSETIITAITPDLTFIQYKMVLDFSRILLISQLPLLVFGNILSALGQANKIFFITALAPVFYNIGIIIGTLFFAHSYWLYAPLIGTVFGAIFFVAIQLPIFSITKFKYIFFSYQKAAIYEFFTLFTPRALAVLTNQINLTIDLWLTSFLARGSYTSFLFAQQLQLFPVSFIGMAFGQASLPYISELYKLKRIEQIRKLFVSSILQLLFLSIPLSIFFIFARTPVVRIVFGGKMFDWSGTNITALTLSFFALSIPFHTIFYFITRSFYALHDTKTPFVINTTSIVINIVFSLLFIIVLKEPVWMLAAAFSIAIIVNVILLVYMFYKKISGFPIRICVTHIVKMYTTAFISAVPAYVVLKLLDKLIVNTSRTLNLFFLTSFIFIFYILVYLFLSWLFTIDEIYVIGKMLTKFKNMRKKMLEVVTDVGN